ncbi:MAG: OmpA family protein [Flavobacteriales bacterium]|nr:OmpA family protein [Flavobacteriales bacterium]
MERCAQAWGTPEDLGPTVNTEFDEDGIFVHPDGRTIYFSSKGHNSIGGFDIFRSRFENNAWSAPENLGWPINSPDDDLFFVRTADGSTGFFSSNRPGGLGDDDVYMVQFKNGDETVSANGGAMLIGEASGTIMLKGKITSEAHSNGLSAVIEMVDLRSAKHVADFTTDGSSGDFLLAIPAGRDYAMYVKADGYLPHSKNVSIPKGMDANDMNLDIVLEPMVAGNKVTLHNIFFETNSAILEQQSLPELNQLYYLLEMHHDLRLMIEGHTDNTGTTALNAGLSAERAASVRDHLTKRGIKADRLEAVGSGDSKPLAPNTNSDNRAKNRRTEIKVL